jgi:NADH-quinone oxidoreductase subunit A
MQKAEKNQAILYYDVQNVKYIIIYITLCLAITCLIYVASLLATMKKISNEKRSSFECGFEPFKSAYSFSVLPFYMYAIIFLIFEIELPLGFPAIVYCGILDLHAFFALDLLFLLILITIDFEIKRGLLDQ